MPWPKVGLQSKKNVVWTSLRFCVLGLSHAFWCVSKIVANYLAARTGVPQSSRHPLKMEMLQASLLLCTITVGKISVVIKSNSIGQLDERILPRVCVVAELIHLAHPRVEQHILNVRRGLLSLGKEKPWWSTTGRSSGKSIFNLAARSFLKGLKAFRGSLSPRNAASRLSDVCVIKSELITK